MQLSEIIKKCKTPLKIENFTEMNVKGISMMSKEIKKNHIFSAIKGSKNNGEDYIKDILKFKKIALIISLRSKIKLHSKIYNFITIIRTGEIRKLTAEIASIFYPNSIKQKIAVTGTNGKTSVVHYTRQLWKFQKIDGASFGTLGLIHNGKVLKKLNLTTPEPTTNHKHLNKLSRIGCQKIIFEASSIGLNQDRLYPLKFDVLAFTNLSRDHLDYHKTIKNYKMSKALLFTNYAKKNSSAIINTDSKHSEFFLRICKKKKLKILDFGKRAKFLKINLIKKKPTGFTVIMEFKKTKFSLDFECTSIFEIYNKICSLILVFENNLKIKNLELLKKLKNPIGRLERIYDKKKIKVFVDYAHTPSALNNVLSSLKKITKGKLFCVFGCGGDRDKAKRNLMTREAIKFSDKVIITDDNPRFEDPLKIRNEMLKNLNKNQLYKTKQIGDREKAIQFSIGLLKKNDTLLIAGKGHETFQIVKDAKIHFNDKKIALKFLEEK